MTNEELCRLINQLMDMDKHKAELCAELDLVIGDCQKMIKNPDAWDVTDADNWQAMINALNKVKKELQK